MNHHDKHWGTVQNMYSNIVRLDLAITHYYRTEITGADQQAFAKELWDKFMDEHSHGLVVSELPRYLKHKKDGQLIELNDLKVLDPSKWDSLTLDVRYEWKDQLKLIDRFIEANAEDPDELKSWKATKKRFLTIAKKLESWTYESYVEQLPKGNHNDLGNVRHYRLPSLEAIPMDFPKDRLKVEFWNRLLVLWDGPENKKADNVRAFLTHHYTHGNNPERFRDLVAETVKIFRDKVTRLVQVIAEPPNAVRRDIQARNRRERDRFETLADKMDGWLEQIKQMKPDTETFQREAAAQYEQVIRDEIPGIAVCPFPLNISIGSKETYPNVLLGIHVTEYGMRDAGRWGNHAAPLLKQLVKHPDPAFRLAHSNWTYASIVPKGLPNPYDVLNPRYYLLDGSMYPHDDYIKKGRLSKAANHILVTFEGALSGVLRSPLNLRDKEVVDFLEHHYNNGGNPVALVKHVERIIPKYKVDEFQRMLSEWVGIAKKRLATTAESNPDNSKKKDLTYAVIARLCWCMAKAGHNDHKIVDTPTAKRLANLYSKEGVRAGELLKRESDRLLDADTAFLKSGTLGRSSHGRKLWTAIIAELDLIGDKDASKHAQAILDDL